MVPYKLSPYVNFIENRLIPGVVQHGVSHRLTGQVLEPSERVRAILLAASRGNFISLDHEGLAGLGDEGRQLQQIIEKEFLIPDGRDPLTPFLNQYVTQPIQNPALSYRSAGGEITLVRLSMADHLFSPRRNERPEVIEEQMSPVAAKIFAMADGSKTLREIASSGNPDTLEASAFREAVEFLTTQERQLIKFTSHPEDIENPFMPVNIMPRNLYHSSRWNQPSNGSSEPVIDFHLDGIEDASWEFDLIEPTVNHAFRFPGEPLGGLDYGSRFAVSTLRPEVVPLLDHKNRIEVLEVGGGTGTFARSFLQQSQKLKHGRDGGIELNYHILDLSPALIENQRELLSHVLPADRHFHQDATKFNIPGKRFDLIVANEVVADFPMAAVQRVAAAGGAGGNSTTPGWQGAGVRYLEKYGLDAGDAPDSFLLNAGAFEFVERCFKHLFPGGALLASEYGSTHQYPSQAYQLNHEEFSIHFGHLAACAASVGFDCRLLTLKEFLALDDSVPVLAGQQEHFLTLNHVLRKYGTSLPYAVISQTEFEKQFRTIIEQIELSGFSFLPIDKGYHFGPKVGDFMILIMTRPPDK
jgi:hypothetical protein